MLIAQPSSSSPTNVLPFFCVPTTRAPSFGIGFPVLFSRIPCTTRVSSSTLRLRALSPSSSFPMIEIEIMEEQKPPTFLRESDESNSNLSNFVRARFEKMIREAHDNVCSAIEAADGGGKFKEDVWSRISGGGGISRVLQDDVVWEKVGVNVSVVYGFMPPDAYRASKL